MKEKTHIDRIFEDKLKGFEVAPDPSVWENISTSLNRKRKKKRIIPLWWKLGGIAATLALILTVGNLLVNDNPTASPTPVVVDAEEKDIESNTEETSSIPQKNTEPNIDRITVTDENTNSTVTSNSLDKPIEKTQQTTPDAIVSGKSNEVTLRRNPSSSSKTHKKVENQQLVNNPYEKNQSTKDSLVAHTLFNTDKEDDLVNNNTNKPGDSDTDAKATTNAPKEEFVMGDNGKKEDVLLTEDLASNEDEIDEKEKVLNRWQITPNVAPVYFSSLGEGSSIDKQLINNRKSSEINISYGIKISYALNEKLSIRSGVNKVDLGYSTKDITVLESSFSPSSLSVLRHVKTKNEFANLSFLSNNRIVLAESSDILSNQPTVSLNQNLSFYEIPLELQYALINKKLGVSVIGGFSTLMLSDNEITYEKQGQTSVLGEATNINNTSFSANFGFGLEYNFSKSINLSIDPMLKYQINTFNNTAGNFRPYFIGVYSGLNITF